MVHFVINYLWHSLVGWVGVTGLVLAAAIAVWVFLANITIAVPLLAPFTRSIQYGCLITITICCGLLYIYPKAYIDGATHVREQWKQAEQKARETGDHARADALRDAASGVRDQWDDDGR
jgi:type VI protein secretion system component VasK